MIELPAVVIPQPAGMASLVVPIPNIPAIVGVRFYTQAGLVQPPTSAHFTGVVTEVIR